MTEKVRKRAGSIAAVVDPGAAEAGRVEVCGEGEVTAAAAAVCSCECRSLCLWAEPRHTELGRISCRRTKVKPHQQQHQEEIDTDWCCRDQII